jgi:hypothetical protein
MAETPQRPKGGGGALVTLDAAITVLNIAKDASGIAPAQAAFGSVSVLLTMIRVRPLLFHGDGPSIHTYPGLDGQRAGLRRPWAELRRNLYSARSGDKREEAARPQPVRAGCDKPADDVS